MYSVKQVKSWDLSHIHDLVGVEEGLYLEFKKPSEFLKNGKFIRDEFISQITETVSAFINSDGGVILLGVQTDRNPQDKKAELLKPIDSWSEKQTFEYHEISLTTSQIQDLIYLNLLPKPSGIEVKEVNIPIENIVTSIYVITVPKSLSGAHQSAKTMRYYRRTADGDVPMLDYEIRDVNNRRSGPLLHLECAVFKGNSNIFEDDWKSSSAKMKLVNVGDTSIYRGNILFSVSNFGKGTSNIARFDIGIPITWNIYSYSSDSTDVGAYWNPISGLRYLYGNRVTVFWTPSKCLDIPLPKRNSGIKEQEITWQQVIYSGNEPPAHPIWSNAGRIIIGMIEIQKKLGSSIESWYWIPWRALSDEMPETRGAILLKEDAGYLYIYNYEMDTIDWWGIAEDENIFEDLKQKFNISS